MMPRRMLLITLAAGIAGSSLCAFPALPAGATPAPAKPPAAPKYVTDRDAFWALPSLETGVDLGSPTYGGDIPAFVPVRLDQQPVREAVLEAVRTLRRELYAREDVLYEGVPLRKWLRQRNIHDADTFAARVMWSRRLELASAQRVAELAVLYSTDRPAGGRGSSMKTKNNKQFFAMTSENIARGDASTVHDLFLQTWGRDQVPAFIASGGKSRPGCHELWWLLNTDSGHLALGVTAAGGNLHTAFTTAYRPDGPTPEDDGEAPLKGAFRVQIAVLPERLPQFTLYAPKLMMVGESVTVDVRTTTGIRVEHTIWTQAAVGYLDTTPEGQVTATIPGQYEVVAFISSIQAKAPIEVRRFTDVPVKSEFFREIEDVAVAGVARGWEDKTYRPLALVSREAMSAFLYRTVGSPAFKAPAKSPFRDVSTRHQFYKEISWMAAKKISTGWPDGTFRPSNAVTREEMAAFMYLLAGSPNPNWPGGGDFIDVSASAPFSRAIRFMRENGISRGWGPESRSEYRPKEPVRRDAMAAFLSRYRYGAANNGFH